MKAVLLCAGYGTRLKPLTDFLPKPMVSIMGIPILEYAINLLAENGVKEFLVNTHYMPDKFKELRLPKDVSLELSYEPVILGTAGGLLSFAEKLDEDFLLVNGDILFNMDIKDLVAFHKKSKKLATMVLTERVKEVTPVLVDDFHNVVGFGKKEDVNFYKEYMFTGIHVMNPKIFKFIKKAPPPSCIIKEFYKPYIKEAGLKVGAYILKQQNGDFWRETGDIGSYIENNLWMLRSVAERSLKGFYSIFVNEYFENLSGVDAVSEPVENMWIGNGVKIDRDATIIAPIYIGAGTIVEAGSVLGPELIVGKDVVIGKNTVLNKTIVKDGAMVKEGTRKTNELII